MTCAYERTAGFYEEEIKPVEKSYPKVTSYQTLNISN